MKAFLKSVMQLLVPARFLVYHGNRRRKEIALTFDDGPNTVYTARILELLRSFNIKASFFLVGAEIERNAELCRQIKDGGHCLFNHTYSHRLGRCCSAGDWRDEITRTNSLLADLGCSGVALVRPPRGILSIPFVVAAMQTSSRIALWSIDSQDWQKAGSAKILEAVFARPLRNGDIILMHDDNEHTLAALPALISRAVDEGFSFVTLDHLWRSL